MMTEIITKVYFNLGFFIKTIPKAEMQTAKKGMIPANKIFPLVWIIYSMNFITLKIYYINRLSHYLININKGSKLSDVNYLFNGKLAIYSSDYPQICCLGLADYSARINVSFFFNLCCYLD